VGALLHHLVEEPGLVAEHGGRGGGEAELQRDGGDALEVRVAGHPHLAEAADAEQVGQFPVTDPRRAVARLEARQLGGQQRQEVLGLAEAEAGRQGGAAGVGGPLEGLADGGGDLGEVAGQGQLDGERLVAGDLLGDGGGLGLDLLEGRLGGVLEGGELLLLALLGLAEEFVGVGGDVVEGLAEGHEAGEGPQGVVADGQADALEEDFDEGHRSNSGRRCRVWPASGPRPVARAPRGSGHRGSWHADTS
jgi:hypothetical protein